MRRVVLDIDRLVLRGVDRADASALAAGLQNELQALLAGEADTAVLAGYHTSYAVRAGQARVPTGADAAALGRVVARRILRSERRT